MAEGAVVLINGAPFLGWKSLEVSQGVEEASGEATITLSPLPGVPMPVHLGDTAQVILAGQSVINGHVHEVSGEHERETHDLTAHVRDKTQDAIDSTLGPQEDIKPPVTLKDAMSITLGNMGLSSIGVVDEVGPEPYGYGEVPSGAVDEFGFDFLERWARKRQCLLTTDGNGNFRIWQNKGKRASGMLHKGPEDDPLNNILKASYSATDTGQHNGTGCAGQHSANDKKHWEGVSKGEPTAQAGPASTAWGFAWNTGIRPERKYYFRSSRGSSGKTPEETAKWHANVAAARGIDYTATVQGFTQLPSGGPLWWPGLIVPVFDYHFELSTEMLIKSVTFRKAREEGSTTEVCCGPPDSYKPQSEASTAGSRTSKGGMGAVGPGSHPKTSMLGSV